MSPEITRFSIEDFLKTRNEGTITLENSKENLATFCEVWVKAASRNVLADLRGRSVHMTEKELIILAEVFSKTGLGYLNKVAFVYTPQRTFAPAQFFAVLAQQKGMSLRAFDSYEDAIEWLGTTTPVAQASCPLPRSQRRQDRTQDNQDRTHNPQ